MERVTELYENFIDEWILKGTYNALKCLRTQDTLKPLSAFVEPENLAALVNPELQFILDNNRILFCKPSRTDTTVTWLAFLEYSLDLASIFLNRDNLCIYISVEVQIFRP